MRSLLSALAWVIVALVADIGAASAQQPGRVYKIAWLWNGRPGYVQEPIDRWTGPGSAFRDALRDRGYVVGKNLVVDVRNAQGDLSQLPALAEALVATQPDVLVTTTTAAAVAAMQATKTIPIVFLGFDSPVERGIVKSLVNHGGNVTGTAVDNLPPKMWQLLRDVAPAIRRVGYVGYAPNSFANRTPEYRADRMAKRGIVAAQAGMELVDLFVDSRDELEAKVAALASRGDAALVIVTDPILFSWRDKIMAMVTHYRLPTVCVQWFAWAQAGCLITYGEDQYDLNRRTAALVARVLGDAGPQDIPIEQTTRFKLFVNAKTAKTLDISLPLSLLALAEEVIE